MGSSGVDAQLIIAGVDTHTTLLVYSRCVVAIFRTLVRVRVC
jgi:hypothetical protein